jgi:hypothetical protein
MVQEMFRFINQFDLLRMVTVTFEVINKSNRKWRELLRCVLVTVKYNPGCYDIRSEGLRKRVCIRKSHLGGCLEEGIGQSRNLALSELGPRTFRM